MREKIVTACDIGSSLVKVGCAILKPNRPPRLIGAGVSPSLGVRRGQIIDIPEVVAALKDAFSEAERTAGVKISRALVVVGGPRFELTRSRGSIAISRADGVVSEDDIRRVVTEAQAVSLPQNKVIIQTEPLSYAVDNEGGIENPNEMKGVRLEVTALLVLALSPILKALKKAVEETGREAENWAYAPLAVERAVLSEKQTEAGVALLNIGGSGTTVALFKERNLVNVATIPLGGAHVTHDLAIGLKTALDVAERIKVEHGHCFAPSVSKREQVVLADWGLEHVNISRYALAQIIENRMRELFELVARELRKDIKEKALPAGVVLTGGGAQLKGIVELAKDELKLPAQIGRSREIESELAEAYEPAWSGVVGAILGAHEQEQRQAAGPAAELDSRGLLRAAKDWLSELLP